MSELSFNLDLVEATRKKTEVDPLKKIEVPINHDEKKEHFPEMLRAEWYWKERLEGEKRIEAPMDPRCEIGIVVPVRDEEPERLLRQIESLKAQKDFDPALVEVIYVVNNDVFSGSQKSQEIIEKNAAVLSVLRQDHGMRIHVIDKSSSGNEIPDCNVGRARNRGVSEMSLRFHENGRNGILLQTDADSWFEDPEYLIKVKQLFDEDPDTIGIAGGLIMRWDPDTKDLGERRKIEKKMDKFIRRKTLEELAHFLRDPDIAARHDTHFSGAHMLSRSLESAMVGGLIDAKSGEDPQFGKDLTVHAEGHGQKVLGKRKSLFITTALRDSDRTAASFKKDFDAITLDGPDMAANVIPEKDLPTFRKEIDAAFRSAYESRDPLALRNALTGADGVMIVTEIAFEELCSFMLKFSFEESQKFFDEFRRRNFGDRDQVKFLYGKAYPAVELTEEYLERIKGIVRAIPNGESFVRDLEEAVLMIQLAKES